MSFNSSSLYKHLIVWEMFTYKTVPKEQIDSFFSFLEDISDEMKTHNPLKK